MLQRPSAACATQLSAHSVRRREVEAASTLEVLAEIAIAIAGFSGVVTALTIHTSQWSELDKIRLRLLLQASFATAFFSLLPLPPTLRVSYP